MIYLPPLHRHKAQSMAAFPLERLMKDLTLPHPHILPLHIDHDLHRLPLNPRGGTPRLRDPLL